MIFDNENLEEIWDLESHPRLELLRGGVSIQVNRKLCKSIIANFTSRLKLTNQTLTYGKELGGVQLASNGDKAPCNVVKIKLEVEGEEHDAVVLKWEHSESHGLDADKSRYILAQVIYYREAPNKNLTIYRY